MDRELLWPTPLDAEALHDRWIRNGTSVGSPAAADRTWLAIERAYSSPTRRYHTLEHIGELLSLLDALYEPDAAPLSLELAGWLHDIVYDATRADNEAASGAWARDELSAMGFAAETVKRTEGLILTTTAHEAEPTDEQALTLSDIDLAILGAPPSRYERYVAAVRAEYGHVDDQAWRAGRAEVLTSFLDRPAIYHHARLQGWDSRARRNVSGELARLR